MHEEGTAPVSTAELSRRVGAILDEVEREAARLRSEARADAARIREDARREAEALVAERRQRIAELSDALVERTEAVVSRLGDAEPIRAKFESLTRALGDAAERLADLDDSDVGTPPLRPVPEPETRPVAESEIATA